MYLVYRIGPPSRYLTWAIGQAGRELVTGVAAGLPDSCVRFGYHELPVWHVDAPGRAAFAGQVMGTWMWLVLWPDTAGVMLLEPLPVRDLRDPGQDLDLPFGAPSPHLPG